MELTPALIDGFHELYNRHDSAFERFKRRVVDFFEATPGLLRGPDACVHSVRSRKKDWNHVVDKLHRKFNDGIVVTQDNLFTEITDWYGVRALHLHHLQFTKIHELVTREVNSGEWLLFEEPVAYTWDPDSKSSFESIGLKVKLKPSYYSSVHYVLRPNSTSLVTCELQVRTIFEEIWGEIDHAFKYPHQTENVVCREQIKVLAHLVMTGSKLATAIFNSA